MERGYYADYDDFANEEIADNPVGYGIDEKNPIDFYGRIKMNTGLDRLIQGMEDIISTPYGSRFMFPEYGCRLHEVLHEQNDYILADLAELHVRDAINKNEPRVVLVDVTAQVPPSDNTRLNIRVNFRQKNSNDVESFVYSTNRLYPEMG